MIKFKRHCRPQGAAVSGDDSRADMPVKEDSRRHHRLQNTRSEVNGVSSRENASHIGHPCTVKLGGSFDHRSLGLLPTKRPRVSIVLLLSTLVISSAALGAVDGRKWSIEELASLRFPYAGEDNRHQFMDVCKAHGYLHDVALTKEEVGRLHGANATLRRLAQVSLAAQRQQLRQHSTGRTPPQRHLARGRGPRRRPPTLLPPAVRNAKKLADTAAKQLGGLAAGTGGRTSRNRRAATARPERIWNYGVIPYEIQSNFSGEKHALFRMAMRHWENETCIQFVERAPEDKNYIVFTTAECGCCSFVGRRGDGPQAISIGKNCDKFGIVVHELGHVIGFWHEHTRPDRDKFVDIFYKNIQQGQDYNFEKLKPEDVDSLGEPYDFESIMHYARDTFARSMYMDTILPKPSAVIVDDEHRPEIGQRIALSAGDRRQANSLYQCPFCGHTIPTYEGTVEWPDAALDEAAAHALAANGVHCQWRIIASKGERVVLNVSAVRLPPPTAADCDDEKHNYLLVRDGHYFRSNVLGKFCGELVTRQQLLSSGSRLWIELRTTMPLPTAEQRLLMPSTADLKEQEKEADGAPLAPTHGRMILLNHRFICGDRLVADSGMIQSPNYPEFYRPNGNCTWYVTVPAGYQVAVRFKVFELETHTNCQYDYVQFFDGHFDNSPAITAKLCGKTAPTAEIKTTDNHMRIEFRSDNSIQKQGFLFEFVKEFDECATTTHGCAHVCVNTLGSYRCECDIGYELRSDERTCEDACGGYIKAANGTITTPGFPLAYPPNKKCIWEIEAHPLYRITLNFTHFDLEGVEASCEYDNVKVISISPDAGDSGGKKAPGVEQHELLCAALKVPYVFTSTTNRLRIEFTSDNSVQKTGFAAIFFTDKDECSVGNGGCQQICRNTIGSYQCQCESGYVLAEDGFNCKEGGCRHEVNKDSGFIISPNYPGNYPNDKECRWHFVTVPGQRLQLEFVDFAVEGHQSCRYDSVRIFDGASTAAHPLAVLCSAPREVRTDKIVSSHNQLLMVFKSDNSVSRKGFKAAYKSVCGGTLEATDSIGYIYSHAQYGGVEYDHKMRCQWTILAAKGKAVQLRFTHFDLEDEPKCEYDYVKVFDGDTEQSNYIGRFCGVTPPRELVSSGESVLIELTTDDTVSKKGFVAEYFLVDRAHAAAYPPPPATTPAPRRPPDFEPVINNEHSQHGGGAGAAGRQLA